MERRTEWFRAGLLTLLEKGAGLVFSLGTTVLLLRGLSKEDFAAWGLFLIITYTLEMGRNGLIQNGFIRFLNTHRQDKGAVSAISSAALFLSLCFSLISNVLLWGSMSWIAASFQSPQVLYVLPVYFLTNFVMALLYHCNFVQQANFEFRGIFWSTICFRGFLFAWVVFCKMMGYPMLLQHLAIAMLLGALVGLFYTALYARPFLQFSKRLNWTWVRVMLSYGKYVLGTNLSAMFYKSIDKLALGQLIGPAAFAVYDAAGKITQLIEAPSFSIASVVFPQSAAHLEEQGVAGIQVLYERSVGAILAIILPFLITVLLFAEPIMLLFAGPKYLESANILRFTAFFGLFMPFAVQCGTILDATGRPATNFAFTTATAVLNLGLSYVLIRNFGLFGAAYATLTGYSVSFVWMQFFLNRHFGIRWWRAFGLVPWVYKTGYEMLLHKLRPAAIPQDGKI